MLERLRDAVRFSPLYPAVRAVDERVDLVSWRLRGRPAPAPHLVKQRAVLATQARFSLPTLVETGTFLGNMLGAVRHRFERVVSIEVDPGLHSFAARRFAGKPGVTLLLGDSAELLPRVLAELDRPALFWLDAHPRRARDWARGTPIVSELAAVLAHGVDGHVVLVDDAHLFDGRHAAPPLAEVEALVRGAHPGWTIEVEDDVIRAHAP